MPPVIYRVLEPDLVAPPRLPTQLPDLGSESGQTERMAIEQFYGHGVLLPLLARHLEQHPDDTDARVAQIETFLHVGRFEEARAASLRALEQAPDRPDVRALRAWALLDDVAPKGGDVSCNPALDGAAPAAGSRHFATFEAARAKDLLLRGDAQALVVANRAVALDPHNVWARLAQAEATAHLGMASMAAPAALQALTLVPHSLAALHQVVTCRPAATLTTAERTLATEYVQRMEELAPGSAYGAMAAAHLGLGATYPDALTPQPRGPTKLGILLAHASCLRTQGEDAAAHAALHAAQVSFPRAFAVIQCASTWAAEAPAQPEARATLEAGRAQPGGPAAIEATMALANDAVQNGQWQRAIAFLMQVLRWAPQHGNALLLMAYSQLKHRPHDTDEETSLQQTALYAERARACGAAYEAHARYLLGLVVADPDEAEGHLRAATTLFAHDPKKLAEVQTALVCRLVESKRFEAAQGVLDGIDEEAWPTLVGATDDSDHGLEKFRARRAGDKTVNEARTAVYAKNFHKAIKDIELIERDLDIQNDPELYATLLGIKSLAYLELALFSDARRTASRALDVARGNAVVGPITEAQVVRRLLDEHKKQERRKYLLDLANRYLWLIITAGGAGSFYTLGVRFITLLRSKLAYPGSGRFPPSRVEVTPSEAPAADATKPAEEVAVGPATVTPAQGS